MGVLTEMAPAILTMTVLVGLLAGFVKGAVGFAMPMIMISGLGSFLAPELALAALILSTVVANVWQALRDGIAAALGSARRFALYLVIVLLFIAFSAQLVRVLPDWSLFLILGVPVILFSIVQLLGWRLRIAPQHQRRAEVGIGAFAGFFGGISGVWGPPTVLYLTALETPKAEQMRVQGVVYGAGSIVLLLSHLRSGVLNAQTLPLSLAMLVPCTIGLVLGMWAHGRMDQALFKRATLVVLVLAGLNLVRRGIAGM